MNAAGISLLCCPTCSGELVLDTIKKSSPAGASLTEGEAAARGLAATDTESVEVGILFCDACVVWHPIVNHVPVMLIFSTALHERFEKTHAARLRSRGSHTAPTGRPARGEESIQKTFSEEWSVVASADFTFLYTTDGLVELQKKVWFRNYPWGKKRVRRVLDVGCGGFAQEAVALSKTFDESQVWAVDLSLELVKNGHIVAGLGSVHAVVASLFSLPFKPSAFEVVFSQGVLHHTYSTYEAMKSIARLSSDSIFVWVYGKEDHQAFSGWKGIRERARYYLLMVGLRPLMSRVPRFVRVAIVHAISVYGYTRFRFSAVRSERPNWKYRNQVHGTYDYITPRYASVHGFNEVIEWIEEFGFEPQLHSPAQYRVLFGRAVNGVGILGQRS